MSYWITQFRDVALPTRGAQQEVGAGNAYGEVRQLSGGGGFDPQGDWHARRTPWRVQVEGTVTAASGSALVDACGSLRGLLGMAGTLYRTADEGTANSQWTWARCVGVQVRRQAPSYRHCPVQLTFEIQSASWYGTAVTTSQKVLEASLGTATVVNAGDTPIYDAIMRVVPTDTLTSFCARNEATGYETEIISQCPVTVGATLTIDCGERTVNVDGDAAFGTFSYGPNAKRPDWLVLAPGTNEIVLVTMGANTTTTFSYYPAYA